MHTFFTDFMIHVVCISLKMLCMPSLLTNSASSLLDGLSMNKRDSDGFLSRLVCSLVIDLIA